MRIEEAFFLGRSSQPAVLWEVLLHPLSCEAAAEAGSGEYAQRSQPISCGCRFGGTRVALDSEGPWACAGSAHGFLSDAVGTSSLLSVPCTSSNGQGSCLRRVFKREDSGLPLVDFCLVPTPPLNLMAAR